MRRGGFESLGRNVSEALRKRGANWQEWRSLLVLPINIGLLSHQIDFCARSDRMKQGGSQRIDALGRAGSFHDIITRNVELSSLALLPLCWRVDRLYRRGGGSKFKLFSWLLLLLLRGQRWQAGSSSTYPLWNHGPVWCAFAPTHLARERHTSISLTLR